MAFQRAFVLKELSNNRECSLHVISLANVQVTLSMAIVPQNAP